MFCKILISARAHLTRVSARARLFRVSARLGLVWLESLIGSDSFFITNNESLGLASKTKSLGSTLHQKLGIIYITTIVVIPIGTIANKYIYFGQLYIIEIINIIKTKSVFSKKNICVLNFIFHYLILVIRSYKVNMNVIYIFIKILLYIYLNNLDLFSKFNSPYLVYIG